MLIALFAFENLTDTSQVPDATVTTQNADPIPDAVDEPVQPATGAPADEQTEQAITEDDIRRAQQALAQLNYNPGPIDGKWGAQTARALRSYQERNGLPSTGQPGDLRIFLSDVGRMPVAGPEPDAPRVLQPKATDQPTKAAASCVLTLRASSHKLKTTATMFGTETVTIPTGSYTVIERKLVPFAGSRDWWFKINVGGRLGWIHNNLHVDLSGSTCP